MKIEMYCANVQRIKEHGVETNIITMGNREASNDVLRFEEFTQISNYTVGRTYEISIEAKCDG